MSIVIVGVGTGCDFERMDQLDGDEVGLRARNGKLAARDIVQFVPFRHFKASRDEMKVAEATLAEIPLQVTSYMKAKGVAPGERPPPPPPPGIVAPRSRPAAASVGGEATRGRPPPPSYQSSQRGHIDDV